MSSTTDTDKTTPTSGVDDVVTVAFRELVVCYQKQNRRPTELVTVGLKFSGAVLGPRGADVEEYLNRTCQLDATDRLVEIPEKDTDRIREACAVLLTQWTVQIKESKGLTMLLVQAPGEPEGQQRATEAWLDLDFYKILLRWIGRGRVVYAHWRAAHPFEALSADGTMSNMWGWMSEECKRRKIRDNIKAFEKSSMGNTRGSGIGGQEATAPTAAARALPSSRAMPTEEGGSKMEGQPPSGGTVTQSSRKRKGAPTASLPVAAATAATKSLPTSADTEPGATNRTAASVRTSCTSCPLLWHNCMTALEMMNDKQVEAEHKSAQEVAGLQRELALLHASKAEVERTSAQERAGFQRELRRLRANKAEVERTSAKVIAGLQRELDWLRAEKEGVECTSVQVISALQRELAQERTEKTLLRQVKEQVEAENGTLKEGLRACHEAHGARLNQGHPSSESSTRIKIIRMK